MSLNRMDMERRREEAQRRRATQAQLASRSQVEDFPDVPLFEAPRKIDQSDKSAVKIKEIFGEWHDFKWVSGMPMPIKATSKPDPGPGTGSPASGSQTSDHSSSNYPPRINGQHKYPVHHRTEPLSQDHRRDLAGDYAGSNSSGTGRNLETSRLKSDDRHKGEVKPGSFGRSSPTPTRPHPTSGGLSNALQGKHSLMRETAHSAGLHSSVLQLSVSPKSKLPSTVLSSHGKHGSGSPALSSQDRSVEGSSQSLHSLSTKASSLNQPSSYSLESQHQRQNAHFSLGRSGLPDKTLANASHHQASTPPPVHQTSPQPFHHTPPGVSGSGDSRGRSPGGQGQGQTKPKHLTLQIKQEPPVGFKDLDNIFQEMTVRPPHTAIQTPVKGSLNRFPFPSTHDEDYEGSKSKPNPASEKELNSVKCKEEPLVPENSSSFLEDDLAVSDSEDEGEDKADPDPTTTSPSKKRDGPASSSNESSSDSESSSDDSSDSDSSSSGDEKEGEDKEGEVQVEVKKEEPEENSQSVWNLKNFMVARPSPPVPAASGGHISADSAHSKHGSDQDVTDVKVSPRKMAEIGPCNSMPFMPHEDLDTILRNSEKASLSPDAPSTASSTASSQHVGKAGHGKDQGATDSQQVPDKLRVPAVSQGNIKSGPGRPKSVPSDRTSCGGSATNRKGSSRDETYVVASERKRKRKDSASGIKVKESRPPLVRTSSSSDVDIESVTPDPKSSQAASVLTKLDQVQEGLDSVSKQLFISPLSSPQSHYGQFTDNKSAPPHKSKLHHKDHSNISERSHKQESSAASSHAKASSKKASSGSSSTHIDSIMAEFKLPAMLSPTEPLRSPVHEQDSKIEDVAVGYTSNHVPTSTCGRPSIVVRIDPDRLRSRPSSSYRHRTSGSKAGSSVPSVLSNSVSVEKGAVIAGSDSLSVPGACNKNSADQTAPVSPPPSNTSSPVRLPMSKHKKEPEASETVKKQKQSSQQLSKSSSRSTAEGLQNGVSHTDVKKASKRTSERRSSSGSTRSSSSKKPKQELQSKPQPTEVPQQNGLDTALPFNSYSTSHSPAHVPAATPTSNTSMEVVNDPLLPTEDRLEQPDFYLLRAKELKHTADKAEKPAKLVPYMKSILYFIMWGYSMEKQNHNEPSRVFSLYLDTCQLLQYVSRFRNMNAASSYQDCELVERDKKLSVLILRMQSLLNLKMFNLKKPEAMKFKKIIEHEYKSPSLKISAHAPSPHQNSWNKSSTGIPSPMSPTPSPTCSIGSVGSQGSCEQSSSKPTNGSMSSSASAMSSPGTVTVPQRIHSVTQKYMAVTSHLVQSHDLWEQSESEAVLNKDFFGSLDNRCGPLSLHSSMLHLVVYVNSALKEMNCS